MRFNVAQLLKEPVGTVRDYEVDEDITDVFTPEIVAIAPLVGKAHLVRTNRGIYVESQLKTSVRLSCSRCLEEYIAPVSMSIREEYLPTIDINTGLPIPPAEEGEYLQIDENHILDMTDVVRQYILTSLPMQPLCKIECKGLCPDCGHNLNMGQCECKPVAADARWNVLGELLREVEETQSEKDAQKKSEQSDKTKQRKPKS
jgi:uncharacterized protein